MRRILVLAAILAMILVTAGGVQAYSINQGFSLRSPGLTWNNPYDATSNPYPFYSLTFTDDISATHLLASTAPTTSTPLLYLFDSAHTPGFSKTNPSTFTNWLAYAVGPVGGSAGFTYDLTAGVTYYLVATETNFGGNPITGNGNLTVSRAAAVPIPATVWLLGTGLAGLAGFRKRVSG